MTGEPFLFNPAVPELRKKYPGKYGAGVFLPWPSSFWDQAYWRLRQAPSVPRAWLRPRRGLLFGRLVSGFSGSFLLGRLVSGLSGSFLLGRLGCGFSGSLLPCGLARGLGRGSLALGLDDFLHDALLHFRMKGAELVPENDDGRSRFRHSLHVGIRCVLEGLQLGFFHEEFVFQLAHGLDVFLDDFLIPGAAFGGQAEASVLTWADALGSRSLDAGRSLLVSAGTIRSSGTGVALLAGAGGVGSRGAGAARSFFPVCSHGGTGSEGHAENKR